MFNAIRNYVIDTKDGIEYQISDQGDNDKALGEKKGLKPSNRCQTRVVSDNMVIEDFNAPRLSESVIVKQKCIGIVTASSTPSMDIKKWECREARGVSILHTANGVITSNCGTGKTIIMP
ncbi:hypothetical protein FPHYL_2735 [Fusarium phyllophilum]|uniref:Uncharacterized protein n=1 Tax=Fusarium phyllophilum TaxID=47803 RepID=A0A8H5K8H5_9HYPO|nr:hypothetical protein FPHYL_2735 [Fusarium phyllophilum]